MIPIYALATVAWMLAAMAPASAEDYLVVNADNPGESLQFDCPESPAGRDLSWVTKSCALSAGTAPVAKVEVRGWNPKGKKEIIGKARKAPIN